MRQVESHPVGRQPRKVRCGLAAVTIETQVIGTDRIHHDQENVRIAPRQGGPLTMFTRKVQTMPRRRPAEVPDQDEAHDRPPKSHHPPEPHRRRGYPSRCLKRDAHREKRAGQRIQATHQQELAQEPNARKSPIAARNESRQRLGHGRLTTNPTNPKITRSETGTIQTKCSLLRKKPRSNSATRITSSSSSTNPAASPNQSAIGISGNRRDTGQEPPFRRRSFSPRRRAALRRSLTDPPPDPT